MCAQRFLPAKGAGRLERLEGVDHGCVEGRFGLEFEVSELAGGEEVEFLDGVGEEEAEGDDGCDVFGSEADEDHFREAKQHALDGL